MVKTKFMTKTKISRSLSEAITRATRRHMQTHQATGYKDLLIAEILADDASYGYQLLTHLMEEWRIATLRRRILKLSATMDIAEVCPIEEYYNAWCRFVDYTNRGGSLSTAHLLYSAIEDCSSATAQLLHHYGINGEDIITTIRRIEQRRMMQQPTALTTIKSVV